MHHGFITIITADIVELRALFQGKVDHRIYPAFLRPAETLPNIHDGPPVGQADGFLRHSKIVFTHPNSGCFALEKEPIRIRFPVGGKPLIQIILTHDIRNKCQFRRLAFFIALILLAHPAFAGRIQSYREFACIIVFKTFFFQQIIDGHAPPLEFSPIFNLMGPDLITQAVKYN